MFNTPDRSIRDEDLIKVKLPNINYHTQKRTRNQPNKKNSCKDMKFFEPTNNGHNTIDKQVKFTSPKLAKISMRYPGDQKLNLRETFKNFKELKISDTARTT
jgi:hypothetical protein